MNLRNHTTVGLRRKALEEELSISLTHIGEFSLDEDRASQKHCENMVGAIQLPVGVVGPVTIHYSNKHTTELKTRENIYVPLATTEGALVASVSRGAKAIVQAGGAYVVVEDVGTTRGPVFQASSLSAAHMFAAWIEEHREELETVSKKTSKHISLVSISTHVVGSLVYVRFSFQTGEAMGMNMVTIASQSICEYVERICSVVCLSVSGNACVDKKQSWTNQLLGRGLRAWAEVFVSTDIITGVLKTTPEKLFQVWQSKCLVASVVFGNGGANGHAANVVAALYIATGQDPAHVVEGSQTVTTMMEEKNGLRISVFMPAILAGTVGGGTMLSTQQEALSLMQLGTLSSVTKKEEFAGIIAGTVLAGELSELAALASGTLTQAHVSLAR